MNSCFTSHTSVGDPSIKIKYNLLTHTVQWNVIFQRSHLLMITKYKSLVIVMWSTISGLKVITLISFYCAISLGKQKWILWLANECDESQLNLKFLILSSRKLVLSRNWFQECWETHSYPQGSFINDIRTF